MTKLGEWLIGLTLFFGIYTALLTKQIEHHLVLNLVDTYFFEIQILPVVLIFLLGVYAVVTVLYRTLTFNECLEAADELKREIKEARADLRAKGMTFDD